jgi:hypothetical protein
MRKNKKVNKRPVVNLVIVGAGGKLYIGKIVPEIFTTAHIRLRDVREIVTVRALASQNVVTRTLLELPFGNLLGKQEDGECIDFYNPEVLCPVPDEKAPGLLKLMKTEA